MSATPHPRLQNSLCDLLGVKYPIIQTGMGWVAGPKLVSATANAGALGILASATMDLDQLKSSIAEVKSRTTKPFGVNLRADSADVKDRISLMIDEGIKVASFAQAPKPELISRLKDAGVVVIPSIGAKRHAEKVLEWGVDAVLVQGGEGGGHTGAVPTTVLLPQVVDAVAIECQSSLQADFLMVAASLPPLHMALLELQWEHAFCSPAIRQFRKPSRSTTYLRACLTQSCRSKLTVFHIACCVQNLLTNLKVVEENSWHCPCRNQRSQIPQDDRSQTHRHVARGYGHEEVNGFVVFANGDGRQYTNAVEDFVGRWPHRIWSHGERTGCRNH